MLHRPSFGRTNFILTRKLKRFYASSNNVLRILLKIGSNNLKTTLKKVAAAKALIEQQANDVFSELNVRVSQEANAMALLRGSLTQAQREAQAEAS